MRKWAIEEEDQEWKEIMLLILGAFIGSYQRVIDFWFNNAEQDKEIAYYLTDMFTNNNL